MFLQNFKTHQLLHIQMHNTQERIKNVKHFSASK